MKKPSFWNELEPQQRGLLTGIILVAIVVLCIAGTKISRLTQTRTIQGDSLFVVVTGATEKATRAIEATNLITELAQFPAWTNSITGIAGAGGGLQSSNVSTNTLIYDTLLRTRAPEPGFEVWDNFDREVAMGSGLAGVTSSGHQWRPAGDTNAMVISGGKFYIGAATNSAIYLSVTNIQDAVPLGKAWSKIGGKFSFVNQGGGVGSADSLTVILSDTTLENGLSGNYLHVVIQRTQITVQRNLGTTILQEAVSLDPSASPTKVFDFDLTIVSNNVFVTCGPNKFVAYASDLNTYAIKPVVTWECFGSTTNQFVGAWHSAYAGYADASTLADDGRNGVLGTNGYRFPLYNHLTANRVLMADAGKRLTNVVSSDPSNEYVKADGTTGVPAAGITTNGNQFLGVPLAIKDSATVTNLQLVGNTIAGTGQSITSHQFTNNGVGVFEHSMQINGRIIPNIQKLVSASIPIGNSSGPNYSIATNDSVVFTHSGSALHGQGFSLIVSNTAATNLPIGFPAAYSLQYRSNVTSWTVAASNYVILPFIRTTNEVGGGIWLLGSVSELEADLEVASAGGNGFLTKLTNAPGTVVTLSNSYIPQAASMVLSNLAGTSQYFTNGQASSMVLSNLVGTAARNVTNVVSLSTSNATSNPLTNSYTAGVLTLYGIEQGTNAVIYNNGSNLVINAQPAGGGLATNANQFGASTTLSLKDGVRITNSVHIGDSITVLTYDATGTNMYIDGQTVGNHAYAPMSTNTLFILTNMVAGHSLFLEAVQTNGGGFNWYFQTNIVSFSEQPFLPANTNLGHANLISFKTAAGGTKVYGWQSTGFP